MKRYYIVSYMIILALLFTSCSNKLKNEYTEMAEQLFPEIRSDLDVLRCGVIAEVKGVVSSEDARHLEMDLPQAELDAIEHIYEVYDTDLFTDIVLDYYKESGIMSIETGAYSQGMILSLKDYSKTHIGIYYFEEGQTPEGTRLELEGGYWLVWGNQKLA